MQRFVASSITRSISRGSMNLKKSCNTPMRRQIQKDMQRKTHSTLRLAVANEISSLRLAGAMNGFEESLPRGWDLGDDDDGG
mmetsp:Transcript_12182/g.17751  ORF Transcript_12182/g.17751 Transcript_12182/m.17751 type:complete len:82 (-) Transcript_12182:93-338(-)